MYVCMYVCMYVSMYVCMYVRGRRCVFMYVSRVCRGCVCGCLCVRTYGYGFHRALRYRAETWHGGRGQAPKIGSIFLKRPHQRSKVIQN